jgi:hypothetical protein
LEAEVADKLEKDLTDTFGCTVVRDSNDDAHTYVRNVELCMKAPYDINIWMDADTVILGAIDAYAQEATTHDIVLAHFAGWPTATDKVADRIQQYEELIPAYVPEALGYGYAVNTGVFGFPKDSPILHEWLAIAQLGSANKLFIPDEIACQILAPRYNTKILPSNFNVSVRYNSGITDWRVLHYHGSKHCRSYPACGIWLQAFILCLEHNVCDITFYTLGGYDRRLREFLAGKYGWHSYVGRATELLHVAQPIHELPMNTKGLQTYATKL